MVTPLAGLLLILALPAAAAPPASLTPRSPSTQDCVVPLLGRPEEYMSNATDTPQPFAADSSECLEAVSLLADFRRLRAAAGLDERISLRAHPATFDNASFNPLGYVTVTLGLLRSRLPRDERVFALAHELGHAWQYAGPTGVAHETLSDRLNERKRLNILTPEDYRTWNNFSRPFESHADLLGMELLVRVGYSADAARVAAQRFSDCGTAAELATPAPDRHPHNAQRAYNAALGQVLLSASPPANDGPRSPPRFSFEDFDADGRFIPRDGGGLDPALSAALRRAASDGDAQRNALRVCRVADADIADRSLSIEAWGRLLNNRK